MSEYDNGKRDATINDLCDELKGVRSDVKGLIVDVATLKVKSSLWGGLGGLIATAGLYLVTLLKEAVGR